MAQLPCPTAADAAWTGFPQFPGDQRNKILFCQNRSASGQQMRRILEFSSIFYCFSLGFFSFSILRLHFKKLSLAGGGGSGEEGKQKLTFVKRLRLGSCVEVMVFSQCQPPFPRVVSCNVFIYHYRRPKFFFLFGLFCPRPQGSDRDQQHSRSDEAARQKLN